VLAALLSAALATGFGLTAAHRFAARAGPESVARDFFQALAGGDAPAALALSDDPPDSPWLTSVVLGQQLRVAAITGISVLDSSRLDTTATVRVRYQLRYSAIDYAASHGARIISMSLGGPRTEGEDRLPCPSDIQDAVRRALRRGALVVAASGNSAQSGSPVEEPGVCLGVVSVGAVDARLRITGFSSRHRYLSVTAPGSTIATLNREPAAAFVGAGTSHATALTSAALALVWSKYPRESGRQVLSRLLATATDRGPKGRDPEYGVGVIDPYAAIAAGPAVAAGPNPVLDGAAPLLALARARASAPRPAVVAPAPDLPLGEYRVGSSRPARLDAAVALPAAGAAGFGALALVLLTLAIRRRRGAW
jgi:subtilisin family serine protease